VPEAPDIWSAQRIHRNVVEHAFRVVGDQADPATSISGVLGESERIFLLLDPATARDDGEMDFVQ